MILKLLLVITVATATARYVERSNLGNLVQEVFKASSEINLKSAEGTATSKVSQE